MDDLIASDIDSVSRIEAVQPILEVLCRITGMGFSAVARVTEDRWVACAVRDEIDFGLKPGGELVVGTTICNEIRQSLEPVVIDHVAEDSDFCDHPTPAQYGFQSYISVPIRLKDGSFFGTLCAIDPKPASIKRTEITEMFRLFAELIASQLETEIALERERDISELREQFMAVLGHDLRSPLSSISSGVNILSRGQPDEKTRSILDIMHRSVFRMSELIGNVLDLARGRLGDGLTLEREPVEKLNDILLQIVSELRTAEPSRTFEVDIAIDRTVSCDSDRIAQLLSNLASNAVAHGALDKPIRISARTTKDEFVLVVANAGQPINPEVRARLFQPYYRSTESGSHEGLGLGLYIASEIARAHGGALAVSSDETETSFTFTIPQAGSASHRLTSIQP